MSLPFGISEIFHRFFSIGENPSRQSTEHVFLSFFFMNTEARPTRSFVRFQRLILFSRFSQLDSREKTKIQLSSPEIKTTHNKRANKHMYVSPFKKIKSLPHAQSLTASHTLRCIPEGGIGKEKKRERQKNTS